VVFLTPAAALQNRIRIAVSRIGGRLFGVTVGKFWTGFFVRKLDNGDTVLRNARIVSIGVKGMSDLAGWIPVTITPDMVGQTLAVRLDIEVKTTDTASSEQSAWIEAVKKSGGRAGIARSPDDAVRIATGED
jgi:hypothetical protein